jgi:hypothetical protein
MSDNQILLVGGFGAGMVFASSPFIALGLLAFGALVTRGR